MAVGAGGKPSCLNDPALTSVFVMLFRCGRYAGESLDSSVRCVAISGAFYEAVFHSITKEECVYQLI